MEKLVTVLRVSYPQELWIIKGRLESESIQCFTKDELTVQSYSLYSNAVGGVKLQVFEKDVDNAVKILTELGYLKDEPIQPDFLAKIDQKTSIIWGLKKLPIIGRVIVLTSISCLVLGLILYFVLRPNPYKLLTETNWCVTKITFNNNLIHPNTSRLVSFQLITSSKTANINCEDIELRENKDIILPGDIFGHWTYNKGEITVNADSLKNIYNGKYEVDISFNDLILKSSSTIIYAHRMIL